MFNAGWDPTHARLVDASLGLAAMGSLTYALHARGHIAVLRAREGPGQVP